jgi:hypothetical protein
MAARTMYKSARMGVRMFFLFSNRLGCLGSLLVSGMLTLLVLWLMGVF